MQGLVPHGTSRCKRDALPTELTAQSPENSAFPELRPPVNSGQKGTERKPAGIGEQQSPEIVPKRSGEFNADEMREAMAALDWPNDGRPIKWRQAPEGHLVYFVGGEIGPVKIGFTQQPIKARLVCIQNGSPVKLHVLATVRAFRNLERLYHRQFAEFRLHGEWFERSPPVEAEIARLNSRRITDD